MKATKQQLREEIRALRWKGFLMANEQQRLVRYAEAMGRFPRANGHLVWGSWNPLTDANDALELAEKMNVAFERRPYDSEAERYAAWLDPLEHCAATLPAAICAAVDAALARRSSTSREPRDE